MTIDRCQYSSYIDRTETLDAGDSKLEWVVVKFKIYVNVHHVNNTPLGGGIPGEPLLLPIKSCPPPGLELHTVP